MERTLFIFKSQSQTHRRLIIPYVFASFPFHLQNRLAVDLLQLRLIHRSYLHSLSLLAYAEIAGEVILDQLLQPDAEEH